MEHHTVKAIPTKAFFVHTITRDIKLEDCILDLVDNSLDGARNLLDNPVPSLSDRSNYSQFKVSISFSENDFKITDNCGGISLDDAVNYAFTFGRSEGDEPEDYSIGIYGIGMKRSVFKMGRDVKIRSTFGAGKRIGEEPFVVTIDVDSWLKKPDWDFELSPDEPLASPGVEIQVAKLRDAVATEFGNPVFSNTLRRILSRDYTRFVERGLSIVVNGKSVKPYEFVLLSGEGISPMHAEFMLKGVKIEVIAGMAARPSDNGDPDEEGDKEDRSGWYVLCNDRMVVAADKTELTGWGYGGRQRWHPQYRGFTGIILFSAKEADSLPLTTTKRSIDKDHDIYRLALQRMVELTRDWIEYTNRRKLSIEEAKLAESKAQPVAAFSIPINKSMSFPKLNIISTRSSDVTIQYSKSKSKVKDLAQKLGNIGMSAREVGMQSFEYAYHELLGSKK